VSLKIHIAGMAVAIGPFRRQLCAWCGEVLFDYDLRNVMVSPGSGEPTPWKMADLVARDGMAWYSVPMPPDDEPLPSECCVPRPERPAPQLKVVK
jgi:hypothetical protein